jgi:hypothetical protein
VSKEESAKVSKRHVDGSEIKKSDPKNTITGDGSTALGTI